MLNRLGLPSHVLLDPDAWIPRRVCLKLGNVVERITGDAYCGLHVAEMNRLEQFGIWGEAIMRAPSLRAALQVACRHLDLLQTGTLLRIQEEGVRARVGFSYIGRTREDPRQFIEATIVMLLKILLLAGAREPLAVSFEHPQPRGAAELDASLVPRLTFKAAETALIFDRSLLDQRLLGSQGIPSPRIFIDERPEEEELIRSVVAKFSSTLAYHVPTIRDTAADLGIEVRTFQRRLEHWGIPFEVLLDDFRRERALNLLRAGRHTFTESRFCWATRRPRISPARFDVGREWRRETIRRVFRT